MKKYKLSIELLPRGAWGNDFSKTLSKEDWDALRNKCYEKANHTCQICGYKTDNLDAHEVWEFDIDKRTQTLKDIIALCSKCHGVKHFRNSKRLGYGENAKKHFIEVNNCSPLNFAAHAAEAEMNFNERNKVYRWEIIADLSQFGGKDIKVEQRNIPMIENPYSDIDWKNIKFCETKSLFAFSENQECLGPPSVYSIDVDNYQGTITIHSNYSNKIEWFLDDKLVKTKFNVAGKFRTEFKVENVIGSILSFKLTGEGGTLASKHFKLIQSA
jgi:formyltetrahydrofolate synthetase